MQKPLDRAGRQEIRTLLLSHDGQGFTREGITEYIGKWLSHKYPRAEVKLAVRDEIRNLFGKG